MTKLKRLTGMLLVFAFLCSFAGCGLIMPLLSPEEETVASDTEPFVTTEEPADSAESDAPVEPNAPGVFLKSDVEKFKIVHAADLGSAAYAEVQKLSDRINELCGTTVAIVSDGEESDIEQEYEILIGTTGREESAEFVRDFRESDYGYGYLNGKIVIGAGSAGVYAADSAARTGADVILCEIGENIGGMHVCGNVTGYYYGMRGGSF